jgi:hypothetical protein
MFKLWRKEDVCFEIVNSLRSLRNIPEAWVGHFRGICSEIVYRPGLKRLDRELFPRIIATERAENEDTLTCTHSSSRGGNLGAAPAGLRVL